MGKINNPQFSALIFDLDGLVLDTESTYFLAWKKAASAMGFEFKDDFCFSLSGLHFQDVEKKLMMHCGADFDCVLFNQLSGQYWRETVNEQGIPIKKGFLNCLQHIKNKQIPFCLATNSHQVNAQECLDLAGLGEVFSIIISRDQVKHGKPAADIFLSAARAMSRPIQQCLVVEDSIIGLQAAVKAGAISVFIPSLTAASLVKNDLAGYQYSDLDQLIKIL
jgi:HAD superfamily hydrolase (TIGR01509 family)